MRKNIFVMAAAVGVVSVFMGSAVTFAGSNPARAKFCDHKSLGAVREQICAIYDTTASLSASVADLSAKLTAQDGRIKQQDAKIAALEAQVAAIPLPAPSRPPVTTDCGPYPTNLCLAPKDTIVDPWGMYNRESVSYAAFRVSLRRTMPDWSGRGNASQWPANAVSAGIPVDSTPRVGDVAIMAGGYGHAMYVETISGSNITVSQYNYHNLGEYSTMTIPAAGLSFIHF